MPEAIHETSAVNNGDLFARAAMHALNQRGDGSTLFRAQHQSMRSLITQVLTAMEEATAGEPRVRDAANAFRVLASQMRIHQEFENWHLRRTLAADPVARTAADQCDREVRAAIGDIDSVLRRFSCATDWVEQRSAVHDSLRLIFERVLASFLKEERSIFPAFDRHFIATAV